MLPDYLYHPLLVISNLDQWICMHFIISYFHQNQRNTVVSSYTWDSTWKLLKFLETFITINRQYFLFFKKNFTNNGIWFLNTIFSIFLLIRVHFIQYLILILWWHVYSLRYYPLSYRLVPCKIQTPNYSPYWGVPSLGGTRFGLILKTYKVCLSESMTKMV